MKIYASAKIKNSQELISLLRAFYAECNGEESSYEINCQDLKMEMDTKYVPAQTITSICNCDEFKISSKRFDLQDEQEIIVIVPISVEESEEKNADEEAEDVTFTAEQEKDKILEDENPITQEASNNQMVIETPADEEVSTVEEILEVEHSDEENQKEEYAEVRRLNLSIPKLKEILAKSNSLEEDINLVVDFFDGLGKKKEVFKRILEAALKIEPPVSWKKLNEALNMQISTGLQNKFNKEIMSKLGMTMLNFVKVLAEENAVISGTVYETVDQEQPEDVNEKIETSQEVQEEDIEHVAEKPRIKMECMPEIPWFEEMLASIDKTLPLMEKVKLVLNVMHIENLSEKWKNDIIKTVYTSILFSEFNLTKAMSRALVSSKEEAKVTMYMFKLINEFAKKYTESKDKISVESFLEDLSKVLS